MNGIFILLFRFLFIYTTSSFIYIHLLISKSFQLINSRLLIRKDVGRSKGFNPEISDSGDSVMFGVWYLSRARHNTLTHINTPGRHTNLIACHL